MKTNKLVNISILKSLKPLGKIPADAITHFASHTYFETLTKDQFIINSGTSDPWTFYLLSGNLVLSYADGKVVVISGGTSEAQYPIAYIKPRPVSAKAIDEIIFIRLKLEDIDNIVNNHAAQTSALNKASLDDDDIEIEIHKEIEHAYKTDKIIVPSVPDIAMKVREAAQDPEGDMDVITRLIQADASLAARIVHVANSPIYRGQSQLQTCVWRYPAWVLKSPATLF